MDEHDVLADSFEEHRGHLQRVATRMLGSQAEAEDAVQEAWIRLSRSDVSAVDNLRGWLTTVVGRVALDMLRSAAPAARTRWPTRRGRRAAEAARPPPAPCAGPRRRPCSPRRSGAAMLVVLDTLSPAERVAFVLHDLFARALRGHRRERWTAPPPPPSSSPAGPGAACREPPPRPAAIRAGPGPSSTPSWPPPGTASSPHCSPCCTPTSSCAPTRPPSGSARRPRCWARTPSPPRSPAARRTPASR